MQPHADTSSHVLHYIYDPLCGWCYGAAPLVTAARKVMPVQAHGGGMMTGRNRRPVNAALRDYVIPHDRRIAQLTGQMFGDAYFNGLLTDTSAVFDSAPPIAAVLAMQALHGNDAGLDLLAAIQRAHYQDGQRISDAATLTTLAQQAGTDSDIFTAALHKIGEEELASHIEASRALLNYVGGHGFPTFVLQRGDTLAVLETGRWLGQPDAWADMLRQESGAPATGEPASVAQCGSGSDGGGSGCGSSASAGEA